MRHRMRALAVGLVLALLLPGSAFAKEQRRPETLLELVDAMEYTFGQILTAEELRTMQGRRPEEIREVYPELYEKIRQNVKRWTDDWVREAVRTHEKISREKLDYARDAIVAVDEVLAPYFEARGWPYRTINAVFLPQRLFTDRRNRSGTLGMFIPFYPGVFFATVHPSVPTHMVLMHETFHFNEHGSWIGWPLVEGIADSIARRLSLEHGLVTQRQLRRWSTYGKERRVVGYLVERIAERTGQTREAALDTLVAWSVTGDRSRLEQILGAEAVGRVVEASRTASDWHWHLYERAVRAAVPPLEALAEPEGQPAQRNEPDTDAARRDEVVGLRPVELVRPEYPTIARQLEETGRVVALVTVTSAGRVRIDDLECHLDGGIRYRYQCSPLLTATKRALKQWRYSPGLLDGRTVDVHFPVAVDFDLVSGEPVVTLSETPGPDGGPLDHPVCFRMELPLYPPRARQRGTAGWVVARARLDGEGIVRSPTIVRSRPPSVFDESVLAAIPKWRYRKDWKEPQATREIEIQVHFQHAPCDGVESVGILDTDMDHVDVLVVCTGEGLEAD